jgi:hypothetical protein
VSEGDARDNQADYSFARLAAVREPDLFVHRTVEYPRFEIHINLLPTSKDMFNVWFRIEGSSHPVPWSFHR